MVNSKDHPIPALDTRTLHKLESEIQAKIDSGWSAPRGWLFRGLTLFFFSPNKPANEKSTDYLNSIEHTRLVLARNTAEFAAAEIAASLDDTGITHVIVDTDTASSTNISSLRKSLAARSGKKVPRLVSCAWVEESWENGTLLDEERKFESTCAISCSPFPFLSLLLSILCLLLV